MLHPKKEPDHLPPFPTFDLGQLRSNGFVMALGSIPTALDLRYRLKPAQWNPGINLAHDLARGLEIALPLWENGGVYLGDYSANSRHCAIVDTPSWVSTDWGPAVHLSGGDYIWLPEYVPPAVGTFSIWVRWVGTQAVTTPTGDAPETYGPVLAFSAEGDDFEISRHTLGLSGSDPSSATIQYFHSGAELTLESTSAAGDQVWRHIVVTYNDDGCALWIDGKLEDIASFGVEFRALDEDCCVCGDVGIDDEEMLEFPTKMWFEGNLLDTINMTWQTCVGSTSANGWFQVSCGDPPSEFLLDIEVDLFCSSGEWKIVLSTGGTPFANETATYESGKLSATVDLGNTLSCGSELKVEIDVSGHVCQEPEPSEDCWHATGCFGGSGNVDGEYEIGQTWLVNTGTALTCITIDDTATCDDLISVTPVTQFDSCEDCTDAILTGGGGLGSGLGGSANCHYWQFLNYDRVLTDGEIRYLTENPTVLFEAPAPAPVYAVAPIEEEGSGGVLVGGTADVLVTVSVGGGVLVGGSAEEELINSGSGGVLCGGSATVTSVYNSAGSGGLVVLQPTFANGYQFRLPITLAAYRDVFRARVPITVTLPTGASPDAVKFETETGGELSHVLRFYDEASRRFTALVKVDLTDEEQTIYLYWGAN